MDLPKNLIDQFAKAISSENEKQTEDGTLLGTVISSGGNLYVQLDGSDQLMPAESTVELAENQRVTVTIKDHRAVVNGCINDKSITRTTADGLIEIFADNGTFSGTLSAATGDIGGFFIRSTRIETKGFDGDTVPYRSGLQYYNGQNGAAFFAGCSTDYGGTIASPSASNFYVTHGGKLYAKNATLYGNSADVSVTITDGLNITNEDDTDMTLGNVKVKQADGLGGYLQSRIAGSSIYLSGSGYIGEMTCSTSGFEFDKAITSTGAIKSTGGAVIANNCTAWDGGQNGGYISANGRCALVGTDSSSYPQVMFVTSKSTSKYTILRANNTAGTYTLTLPNSTGTLAVSSSDIRLKENIKPSKVKALDLINKIELKEFDWKPEGREGSPHWDIGMIADELEKLDKNLVFGGGENEDGSMNVKGIDTLCLLSYLVGAVQEQAKEIEKLKKQIKEDK